MMLNICENLNFLSIIRLIKIFINIIKVSVPIILIFSASITFFKTIKVENKEELSSTKNIFIKKIVAAILIFIVPTFINLIVTLSFPNSNYSVCLNNSSLEKINSIAYSNININILKLKETLNENDYNNIINNLKYLSNIDKENISKKLDEMYKYILIMQNIKNLKKEDTQKYNELLTSLNNIDDITIKNTLKKELDTFKNNYFVYEAIKPDTNENIVKFEETDTLKVYISKHNNYYLSRIWALNPQMQLNKEDSDPYGNSLTKPSILLEKSINKNNLSNNLIIGFNASGFYLKDTYDASSVKYYSKYDKTSVGTLVITNGKVIRNAYDKWYKTWFISGINSNNNLEIFTDEKMSISDKYNWTQNIINSGIRNTFSFASPLIINGTRSEITTNMPEINAKLNRQAFCQINKNNFLLITGSQLTRDMLINIMLDNNCTTGTNFDGGGSTTLLFKNKNSNNIEVIVGNSRSLTEVAYFSEK